MRRKRHSSEEIIRKLRKAEQAAAEVRGLRWSFSTAASYGHGAPFTPCSTASTSNPFTAPSWL
ncbi:hypothetical protein PHYC_03255 [Phycisphaerales bacterium]|nr:hypothetical protein PHYC_03255 [Phycisphaerales bacterium]